MRSPSDQSTPLELEIDDSSSRGAKILDAIRNQKFRRGQFRIVSIFWFVTGISVFCALPNLFGWETDFYWGVSTLLAFAFLPGLVYISIWATASYGYSRVFTFLIVVAALIICAVSFFIIGWASLVVIAFWLPQLLTLFWLHRLFRKQSNVATAHQSIYEQAILSDEPVESASE
jgi:hypothetical protein